jgi:hypothetical protein
MISFKIFGENLINKFYKTVFLKIIFEKFGLKVFAEE